MKNFSLLFAILLVNSLSLPAHASHETLDVRTYFKIYHQGEHPENHYYTCNERTDLDATDFSGDIIKQYDPIVSISLNCNGGGRNIPPEIIIKNFGWDPQNFGLFYTGNSDGTPLQIWGKEAYCYDAYTPGNEIFDPEQVILQCIELKSSK